MNHLKKSLFAVWIALSLLVGWSASPSSHQAKSPLRTITEVVYRPTPLNRNHYLFDHFSKSGLALLPEFTFHDSIRIHSELVKLKLKKSALHVVNDFSKIENIHHKTSPGSDGSASSGA